MINPIPARENHSGATQPPGTNKLNKYNYGNNN